MRNTANATAIDTATPPSVFSAERAQAAPSFELPHDLHFNTRLKMDGLEFLAKLPEGRAPVAFFDPQYRGVLDKLDYGNEGRARGKARCALPQMSEDTIAAFVAGIDRALVPGGHLFLWMDKFHLCEGFARWFAGTRLAVVDMLTWHKDRIGMGYRTRRASEYLAILQKEPRRAKGVWRAHDIPDVWTEKTPRGTHAKPAGLQKALIAAVSDKDDIVVDPAAGSFSVMEAAQACGRRFLGCDING